METAVSELMAGWLAQALPLAREHCPGPAGAENDCTDYHAVRPFLYCAGLRTSFGTYREMFGAPVQHHAAGRSIPRVLISGAADFIVPAVVTEALHNAGSEPHLAIVDRCRTPLEMCESARRRLDMPWEILQADVRHHQPPMGYDLIVADRFLGFFPPSQRAGILDAWHRQLNAGGRVLATVSIRPDGEASRSDDKSLLNAIRDRYATEYSELLPGVSRDRLLGMVKSYSEQRCRHRICDANEILPLFEHSGLRVTDLQEFRKKTDAGLPVDSTRYMLQVVAEKPA